MRKEVIQRYLAWACVKRPFIMPRWRKGESQ
nr:MAG TPA: hypothetical protein [Caudoviricetes sp.]